ELADHPNRLLVTATPEGGETYAEVAHVSIFRRWDKLRGWISDEREFLAWKTGVETARRTWQGTPGRTKKEAVLMGLALAQAQHWLVKRPKDIAEAEGKFIVLSRRAARRRRWRGRALIGVWTFAIVIGLPVLFLFVFSGQMALRDLPIFWDVSQSALTEQAEQALKPGDTFMECARCPEMVVVPAGSFLMGSPANEERPGRLAESPQREITIRQPFAVSRFELTLDEW